MTIAVAIGRLARRDILVKSGAVLEKLSRGGRLLLDKTGTLTHGQLQLIEWIGDAWTRRVVSNIESKCSHPVARALVMPETTGESEVLHETVIDRADGGISAMLRDGRRVRIGNARYLSRHRVDIPQRFEDLRRLSEEEGETVVLVAVQDCVVALASLGDRVRVDSAGAVSRLRRAGFLPEILSGDALPVVWNVARKLGIELSRAHGAVTPEGKLEFTRAAVGCPTVMVGDGVNDAAALAAADVGIAVHGGAKAALVAADVYIARPGLSPLVELVDMSRRAMRTIRRNLVVSLGYNVLAGALAAGGMMSPILAAILMPLSSATVLSLAVLSLGRTGKKETPCP